MSLPDKGTVLQNSSYFTYIGKVIINFSFQIPENCEPYCWKVEYFLNIDRNIARCGCLCFPHFERLAGKLLHVDGSTTQLSAILLAILLDVDTPLEMNNGNDVM